MVVGLLFDSASNILIAERSAERYAPGLWEFPGGKIEPNESIEQALIREFKEEVGIDVQCAQPWFSLTHRYPEREILLHIWLVTAFAGNPYGAEGQKVKWCPVSSLNQFEFPEGNKEIIKRILENR